MKIKDYIIDLEQKGVLIYDDDRRKYVCNRGQGNESRDQKSCDQRAFGGKSQGDHEENE